MTLLTMCQKVAAATGWPVPPNIAANTSDPTAVQFMALAGKALEQVVMEGENSWPHLQVEYPFTTVIGQDVYELPEDAKVLMQETAFDRAQYFSLKGSVGTLEWNARKYGMLANIWCTGFRVRYPFDDPTRLSIQLDSVPQEARDLVISYVSRDTIVEAAGPTKTEFSLDNDSTRVPEHLVRMCLEWFFRRAKGLDFSVELAAYNVAVKSELAKYASMADIPVGRNPYWNSTWPLTQGYVPETGFGP